MTTITSNDATLVSVVTLVSDDNKPSFIKMPTQVLEDCRVFLQYTRFVYCKNMKKEEINEMINTSRSKLYDEIQQIIEDVEDEYAIVKGKNDEYYITIGDDEPPKKNRKYAEGIFECDKCESKFTQKSRRRRHIQAIHEGVKHACKNVCLGDALIH